MKFTFIANNDFDGVGQTALNLSNNLNSLGHKCELLVLHKKFNNKNTILLKRSFFKRIFVFFLNHFQKNFNELFGFGFSTINFNNLKKKILNTDIIVIFTFYRVISNQQLEAILNLNKIVYLRPLDIEMASGGCHFNNFCLKYENNCSNCPKIYFSKFFKFSEINLTKKKEIINKYKPKVLVQNRYVKSIFDKSEIFKNSKKEVLYIGTNDKRFQVISKSAARRYLGLGSNEKIILFVTFNLNSYVKGGHLLKKSIQIIDNDENINKKNIRLLTLGRKNGFDIKTKNVKWKHLNSTSSHKVLNYLFRASDVLVCPSLFCFGPHVVEEALINKLPVVAYDLGSAKDFVKNNKTGFLVEKYNVKKFADAIIKIINQKKFNFDKKTYKFIINNCSSILEAKKLIKLSQKDLDRK